jgi:hypothetical protein
MNVTEALRRLIPNHPDWTGCPLAPLYDKTGQDEERAARLYGKLVCRVGVNRSERWWCFPEPVEPDHFSTTYVLESEIAVRQIGGATRPLNSDSLGLAHADIVVARS